MRICEVVNGNVSPMCQNLSVPRNLSAPETTQELNNIQPGIYAIIGVTVNSGGEMIPFTSEDLRFLQLQNINITVGKLYLHACMFTLIVSVSCVRYIQYVRGHRE